MTTLIIFLNIIFAAAVVVGMVALHGWAIAAEYRANAGGARRSLRILRARPRIRFPSLRWTRQLAGD